MNPQAAQPAVKDGNAAHPVASDWRPALREVVAAFSRGDFALTGLTSVAPVDAATQKQIEEYLVDYGETVDELPEETWMSSIAQWTGTHWDVLVDLWTKESGKSDLVLGARVFEVSPGDYRIEVDLVYVP